MWIIKSKEGFYWSKDGWGNILRATRFSVKPEGQRDWLPVEGFWVQLKQEAVKMIREILENSSEYGGGARYFLYKVCDSDQEVLDDCLTVLEQNNG
jgi:hypothetical protein